MPTILLVDDQPFMCDFICGELKDEGYEVTCVGDSDYVMSAVEESDPDLILLDLYLKGFEGWDLLQKIKRYDAALPVLIFSPFDSFVGDPRLADADGYVIKDVNTDILKQQIRENLNHGHAA
jgi:DNA-binding response OmpR family regulator